MTNDGNPIEEGEITLAGMTVARLGLLFFRRFGLGNGQRRFGGKVGLVEGLRVTPTYLTELTPAGLLMGFLSQYQ